VILLISLSYCEYVLSSAITDILSYTKWFFTLLLIFLFIIETIIVSDP
jgi:hypothetical protein